MIRVYAVCSTNLVQFESLETFNAVARPLHCSLQSYSHQCTSFLSLITLQTPVIYQQFSSNQPALLNRAFTSASSSNIKDPMHNTEHHNHHIYIYLHSLCTINKACNSLSNFKMIMEAREQKMAGGPQGKGVKEKQGWLEGSIESRVRRSIELATGCRHWKRSKWDMKS